VGAGSGATVGAASALVDSDALELSGRLVAVIGASSNHVRS
jgi:hypothetical protein